MVFFNYSTMQMAAKVVYYGPGLCGKTTNLHWIYSHTSGESRGEMVSLETETDRTLFFDLLPIDIGTIAGFSTRLQLYTVPGQVFYNTTRKLVLKGVDGVVFVADSQRPMLQANLDSLRNLEENLTEMGLTVDKTPMVLQYNKRDLDDILPIEELNSAINRNDWPYFESSAINGVGVFETLKGISKLTLLSLKKRLARDPDEQTGSGIATPSRPVAPPPAPRPSPPPAATPPAVQPAATAKPAAPQAASPAAQRPAAPPQAATGPAAARKVTRKKVDALGELELLRKEAMAGGGRVGRRSAAPSAGGNGHGQLFRDIQLTLKRGDFERARRFSLSLQVEDEEHQVVESVRDFEVEIDQQAGADKVMLKLNIALHPKD